MKYLIIPIIIAIVLLGACKKNSDSAVPDTHGSFMFVNAVPVIGAGFNVKLDSINFASNVPYKGNTGYKSYRAQKYNLIISDVNFPDTFIFKQEVFLRNNRFYSAFLGADSTQKALILIVTEDDMTSLGQDMAKFRVINFSQAFKPNRTPLGIDIFVNTNRVFQALTFPAQTGFVPLLANKPAADSIKFNRDSANIIKWVPLQAQTGKVYTFISTGYPLDKTQFDILTIQHN
jgi:hypothetical protein